jgi:hypothetical protein
MENVNFKTGTGIWIVGTKDGCMVGGWMRAQLLDWMEG